MRNWTASTNTQKKMEELKKILDSFVAHDEEGRRLRARAEELLLKATEGGRVFALVPNRYYMDQAVPYEEALRKTAEYEGVFVTVQTPAVNNGFSFASPILKVERLDDTASEPGHLETDGTVMVTVYDYTPDAAANQKVAVPLESIRNIAMVVRAVLQYGAEPEA